MKKLLGLLGVVSLFGSTITTVVACGSPKGETPTNQEVTIQDVLGEYSKALYVSQQGHNDVHVNSSYIFNNILGSKTIKELGISDSNESVLSEYATKLFDTNNLTNDVKTSGTVYLDGTVSLETPVGTKAKDILGYLPAILEFLSDPIGAGAGMIAIIQSINISSLLSEELLLELKDGLTTTNIELLKSAFSNEIYDGMSFAQATNSSLIGLANAVQHLTNSEPKIYSYKSVADINKNFAPAIESMVKNIGGLTSGTSETNTELKTMIPAIAEIIRFLRTLLIYINTFTYEEMTAKVLTVAEIEKKRDAIVTADDNHVDFKKIIQVLKVLTDKDNESSVVLKNLVGTMFASTKNIDKFIFVYYETDQEAIAEPEGGYVSVLTHLAVEAIGFKSIKALSIDMYISSIIRGFINRGIGKNIGSIGLIVGNLPDNVDSFPDFLKNFIQAIENQSEDEWKTFSNDWIGYLWNNKNPDLNFNLKSFLELPIKKISGDVSTLMGPSEKKFDQITSSTFDIFDSKNLSTVLNELESVFNVDESANLDFNNFKNIFEIAIKNNFFDEFIKNPSNLWDLLGLKDGNFEKGSILEGISKISSDAPWMIGVMKLVNKYLNAHSQKLEAIKSDINHEIMNLKTENISVSGMEYKFDVIDGTTIKSYAIVTKHKNEKLVIESITF